MTNEDVEREQVNLLAMTLVCGAFGEHSILAKIAKGRTYGDNRRIPRFAGDG